MAPFVTVREAWANVNGKGDSNYEHAHGTSVFSGCYYLASGFEEGDSRAATGLRLHKPGGAEEDGGEHWSSQALGRAGTLALWPGAVVHSVPEHTGTGQRMSVAFNVGLTLKTDDLPMAAAAHRRLAQPQEDRYFPAFHARPHAGHVNDPNGPMFYNGHYHLFMQQFFPWRKDWINGAVGWGHMVSSDLVTWRELEGALVPGRRVVTRCDGWVLQRLRDDRRWRAADHVRRGVHARPVRRPVGRPQQLLLHGLHDQPAAQSLGPVA